VVVGLLLQAVRCRRSPTSTASASHFVFFAAGTWVAERQDRLLPLFERLQPLWWAAFAPASASRSRGGWTPRRAARCGLLSVPALHGLIRLPPVSTWSWPLFLGRYAMAIYLFNTLGDRLRQGLLIRRESAGPAAPSPLTSSSSPRRGWPGPSW
jgi:hypothetical protein